MLFGCTYIRNNSQDLVESGVTRNAVKRSEDLGLVGGVVLLLEMLLQQDRRHECPSIVVVVAFA